MKPHSRLRRAALVSGAVVCGLLLGVWIASTRWYFGIVVGDRFWGIRDGTAICDRLSDWYARPEGLIDWGSNRVWLDWSFTWWHDGSGYIVAVPLWFPAGLSLLGTGALWRLDARARRRARVGACAKCGYDRAGLAPNAPCPECGTNSGCGGGQP